MSAKVAQIVGSLALEGQTSGVSTTTVAATEGKLYRISAYLEILDNANIHTESQTVQATIQFSDDGISVPTTLTLNATGGTPDSLVKTVRGKSAASVTVAATITAGTTTTYNLYVTVEEL